MPSRSRTAALAAAALVLGASAPAQADDTLTPEGPATLRAAWNGPVTAEGRPPEVLIGWSVTVGPGGKAGPVRLRVLTGFPTATLRGSGPTEWLPAEPGTYDFSLPSGIPYDPREHGLSLDQEVGGHALLRASAFPEHELHVFRPRVGDDARDVAPSERIARREMLIKGRIERDLDRDRLGDQTQDTGDLRVLSARITGRTADGGYRIEARVRNVGSTVRHQPGIEVPDGAVGWTCEPGTDGSWRTCPAAPLAPGAEGVVAITLHPADRRAPEQITVESEGPDLTPADNVIALAPQVTLGALQRGAAGPRVTVGASRAGRLTLVARIAGVRIVRTISFARADRRAVRLVPRSRADRRRLARALRRNPSLRASVVASMAGGRASLRRRI